MVASYMASQGFAVAKVYRPLYGSNVQRMIWTWELDSLAASEEWNEAVNADEGFVERTKAMVDLFVPGSMQIMAYKEIE